MPNQFRLHGQPRERTIRNTDMLRHAENWKLDWKDHHADPKDFYETLKSRVEDYGVLLKPYIDLNRDEDITTITEENCENYTNARTEMSRALYNLFVTYKT